MNTKEQTPTALDVPAGSADQCPRCGCQLFDPFGLGQLVHDVYDCRGVAMSHQESTFNADVEAGRTIPGID